MKNMSNHKSDLLSMTDRICAQAVRSRIGSEMLEINGIYRLEHIRGGRIIGTHEFNNLITTEGKRHILSVVFSGGTAITDWYVALVSNTGTPTAPSVSQIYDSFFDTVNVEYANYTGGDTGSDRPHWVETLDGSLAKITNIASKATFIFTTGSGSLYGGCLVSRETPKGDHDPTGPPAGILMSFSQFSPVIPVEISDEINVEIEISFS